MLNRLLGLETEYAIRFTPGLGGQRPGNHIVFRAFSAVIGQLVHTQPGERRGGEEGRIFTESGASISYENHITSLDGGLLEAATPECSSPSQLLCHQKALDALLIRAVPRCAARLAGDVGLIKNCRDAEGHVYGAQENYEAEIARGVGLVVYRAALVLTLPVLVVYTALNWALLAVMMVGLVLFLLGALVAAVSRSVRESKAFEGLFEDQDTLGRVLGRILSVPNKLVFVPLAAVGLLPFRLAFRRQRLAMIGFLVSRPIVSGAGTLAQGGAFGLSEKGPSIRRLFPGIPDSDARPIFATGNLLKDSLAPAALRLGPWLRLFERRQRMQLGLSDSNVAQVAEYLKIGTTALVLDMAEAGFLDGAPRPKDPIAALHAIVADPTLKVEVPIAGGPAMTALRLQRHYLDRARAFLRASPTPSMEARQIVNLWEDTLAALESDPGRLVGSLDWVTKRWLIETCAGSDAHEVQKTIDLKYHELGSGYLARLERAGLARELVRPDEIEAAITTPPADTPARLRGQLVRSHAAGGLPVRVSWDSVRIGGRLRGKVIPLRPRGERPS